MAIVKLEKLRNLSRESFRSKCILALLYGEVEFWDKALVLGRELVAEYPEHYKSYLHLSDALAAIGFGEEALRAVDSGLKINSHPKLKGMKIILLLELDRIQEAKYYCEREGLKWNDYKNYLPSSTLVRIARAERLRRAGHIDAMIQELNGMLLEDHKCGMAYFQFGNYYQELGNNQMAADMFQRAVMYERNNENVLTNLALAYYKLGDYRKAKRWAKRAIRKHPNHGVPFLILAGVYEQTGANRLGITTVINKLKREAYNRGVRNVNIKYRLP